MSEENNKQLASSMPYEWMVKKLLGPTFDKIGNDFEKIYTAGRNKIVSVAIRKSNIKDSKNANLRVARDVFWSGSFTDETICAEYFGGILASSRSVDGKDDRGVYYIDIIKSLSSQQLLLHYIFYRSLNKLWLEMPVDKQRPDVGVINELNEYSIWFATKELENSNIISVEKDLIALYNKGVVTSSEASYHRIKDGLEIPYTKIIPSTLGIQLYAVAHNKLNDWRYLPYNDFGEFPDIKMPIYFSFSIDELLLKAGLEN